MSLRGLIYTHLFGAALAIMLTLSTQAGDLPMIVRFWQLKVLDLLADQAKGLERYQDASLRAIALAEAHASSRRLAMQVHAYVLDRTALAEKPVIEAMIQFCASAKRLNDAAGPFPELEWLIATQSTAYMARFFHEEFDHAAVRNSCR